jgi:hypothetical protein
LQLQKILIYLPVLGLVILALVLYLPSIQFLYVLSFMDKITVLLTYALAASASIEGYSTFVLNSREARWRRIEDARNELEKAYGPLYTLLNKASSYSIEEKAFWLEVEERRKIDGIMATYPFMFSSQIYDFWQQKIRNLESLFESSSDGSPGEINFDVYIKDVYTELKNLINAEYAKKVKDYNELAKH